MAGATANSTPKNAPGIPINPRPPFRDDVAHKNLRFPLLTMVAPPVPVPADNLKIADPLSWHRHTAYSARSANHESRIFHDGHAGVRVLRVVRHETGHTLGCPHEHLRKELVDKIDPEKAIEYFAREDGWSAEETRQQVLTPLEKASLIGTAHDDPRSIMCYQISGEITK